MRLFLLFLICLPAWAQATSSGLTVQPFRIEPVLGEDNFSAPEDIVMPLVKSTNETLAAQINDYLFIARLQALAPRRPAAASAHAFAVGNLVRQTFTVSRNDASVLTIRFEADVCTASCEIYRPSYNFDSRTGRKLRLGDLFTEAGRDDLAYRMSQERYAQYGNALRLLKRELRAAQKGRHPEKIDDLMQRIDLYTGCLVEPDHTPRSSLDAVEDDTFDLSPQAFKLKSSPCSAAWKLIDDIGEVVMSVPYAALRSGMTAYGKAVMLEEGTGKREDDFDGVLLRGHLNGKTPVTMLLNRDPGESITGHYFYDKYGKGIPLSGEQHGDTIELTEASGTPGEHVTIRLTAAGSALTGRWVGNGKQFSLRLAP